MRVGRSTDASLFLPKPNRVRQINDEALHLCHSNFPPLEWQSENNEEVLGHPRLILPPPPDHRGKMLPVPGVGQTFRIQKIAGTPAPCPPPPPTLIPEN